MQNEEKIRHNLVVNAVPLLGNLTGVGQVTSEISRRLAADDTLDAQFFTPFKTFEDPGEIEMPDLRIRAIRKAKMLFRSLPFKNFLRNVYSRMQHETPLYDLYWEPNFIPMETLAARRIVTTVHDMSFHEHPEWHPRDRVDFFSRKFFENIGRSDIVVTVSEFSRRQFLESQSGIDEDRVRVIPCGINQELFRIIEPDCVDLFRKQHGLPEQFILFVGSIEPRKNLITLLSAYNRLSDDLKEAFPLVLVGDTGWKNKQIHQEIRRLGRNVRTFGYLESAEALALMYNAATVFAYPSLYEGFGIPPLEAMACGTPVCLSSIPVFHEVYGPQAACYADPCDPDSLVAALTRLLDDVAYSKRLKQAGFVTAQRYTWGSVYDQYTKLFKELMQE